MREKHFVQPILYSTALKLGLTPKVCIPNISFFPGYLCGIMQL